ncbi:MAG: filamentous hemagglutinin N-terminal domain-containing protein, partial [Rhodocyclaceae bacterium]|nr:filamentous hemagglutinin N-terminal domain-containing protein [Rhodocyclaceae bacterium]
MNRHGAMNRTYRLVWSDRLGAWVAVAEIATGRGKRSSVVRAARRAVEVLAGVAAGSSLAWAQGPLNGTVVGGSASILQSAERTDITQTSQRAIIDWRDFSIAAGHTVEFHQPGSSSIALNRVTGDQQSLIDGSLLANGQVWLLNPNGVFIGAGGQVSSRGFLATTSSISNDDFMAGSYSFTRAAKPGGVIVNQGQINALLGGYAVLAGEAVRNHGVVSAELGQVVLAGGRAFAMDLQGDRLISFQVTQPVETLSADGQAVVLNTGSLIAKGGRVTLTARAAEDVVTSVINTGGLLQATSVRNENGTIVLDGDGGRVQVAGTLDASGKNAGETGGSIGIFGRDIALNAASLDATGDAGGGTLLVGGGWQGAPVGNFAPALTTSISADSVLNASAMTNGNGGTLVAWSDVHNPLSATTVAGSLLARGGSQRGDGGRIETSGHRLEVNGITVDTSAASGRTGHWLIDPDDFTVGGQNGNISAAGLVTALNANDVTIQTGPNGASAISGNSTIATGNTGGNGDIHINEAISTDANGNAWTANTLTLSAYRNVNINQSISGTGTSALAVTAGQTQSGTIGLAANVTTGSTQTYSGPVALGADVNLATAAGDVTFTGNLDSASGDVARSLAITSTGGGNVTFGAAIGSLSGLSSLSVATAGLTSLGGSAGSSGSFNYFVLTSTGNASDLTATTSLQIFLTAGTNFFAGTSPHADYSCASAPCPVLAGATNVGTVMVPASQPGVNSPAGTSGTRQIVSHDTFLQLFDPSGNPVVADDDGGAGLASYLFHPVPPNTSGTYTLAAGCYSGLTLCGGTVAYQTATAVVTGSLNVTGDLRLTGSANISGASTVNVGGSISAVSGGGAVNLTVGAGSSGDVRIGSIGSGSSALGNISISTGTLNVGTVKAASLTVDNAGAGDVGSLDLGAGFLTKKGNGTLTLSGTNTYSGGTTVLAGTVVAGTDTAFGSGTVTFANGTTLRATDPFGQPRTLANAIRLDGLVTVHVPFGDGTDIALQGPVSGNGGLRVTGDESGRWLMLSGNNTFSGGVQVATDSGNGHVRVGGDTALGTGAFSVTGTPAAGSYQLELYTESTASVTLANPIFTPSSGQLGVRVSPGGTLTLGGAVSGSGGIDKFEAGTLVFGGANSYTGNTSIYGGTLSLRSTDDFAGPGTSGTYFIASGATLNLDVQGEGRDFSLDVSDPNNPIEKNATFTGTGTISKTGAGVAVWGPGSASFVLGAGGLIDVRSGAFVGGSNGNEDWSNNKASLNVATGAEFRGREADVKVDALTGGGTVSSGFSGDGSIMTGVSNYAAGRYNVAGQSLFSGSLVDADGDSPATLVKVGTGTLTLSGANTYTGVTRVDQGTLTFANRQSLYNGNADLATINRWTADFITVSQGATLALAVGGTTNATSNGTGNFSGLDVQKIASIGTATSGFLDGSRLGLDTSAGDFAYSNGISNTNGGGNALGLVKLGANTLTLSGANTYTGTTTASAGTLTFANRQSLYNGNADRWTAGFITVNPGATLALAVSSATMGTAANSTFGSADVQKIAALGTATGGFLSGSKLGLDTGAGDFTYGYDILNPNAGRNAFALAKLGGNTLTLTGNIGDIGEPIALEVRKGVILLADDADPNVVVAPGRTRNLASVDIAADPDAAYAPLGRIDLGAGISSLSIGGHTYSVLRNQTDLR